MGCLAFNLSPPNRSTPGRESLAAEVVVFRGGKGKVFAVDLNTTFNLML